MFCFFTPNFFQSFITTTIPAIGLVPDGIVLIKIFRKIVNRINTHFIFIIFLSSIFSEFSWLQIAATFYNEEVRGSHGYHCLH